MDTKEILTRASVFVGAKLYVWPWQHQMIIISMIYKLRG